MHWIYLCWILWTVKIGVKRCLKFACLIKISNITWVLFLNHFNTNSFWLFQSLVVSSSERISLICPFILLLLSFIVVMLFFVKNGLKQIFTTSFVHVQYSFCYNVFYLIFWEMIHQMPITVVQFFIFDSFGSVFLYMSPSFMTMHVVKKLGIILFYLWNGWNLLLV